MSGSAARDTAGNSGEGWLPKGFVYCIKVFGLLLKAVGSQRRSLSGGSDTIRCFSDKNNSGRSVEDEIQGWGAQGQEDWYSLPGGSNEEIGRRG